jgi:ssDNA thymidine ADP-ribosyltransferase, DarT
MTEPPLAPSIFHITHVDNLPTILADGCVWCDAMMVQKGRLAQTIGMNPVKQRRLHVVHVDCHPGTKVGDYVPFYFCARSIMLFVIERGNHAELAYKSGQRPIIHLEANVHDVVAWADAENRRWALSPVNAAAGYASFYNEVTSLDQVDWDAVGAKNWRDPTVKEAKQAEFLLHESFPWHLVRRIGVYNEELQEQVRVAIAAVAHKPSIEIKRDWYY